MTDVVTPSAHLSSNIPVPSPKVDWARARSIAALKFRIIRHTPQAIVGMILGLLLGGFLSFGLISLIVALAENERRGSIVTVGGAIGLTLWLLAPLVLGGGELILDFRTLAVYPLNQKTLLAGLWLAATIGIPFICTLAVTLSIVSHASSLLTTAVLLAGAVQLAITGVLAGRVSVGLVTLLASSRFRSVAGGITVLAAVTLGISAQVLSLAAVRIKPVWFDTARPLVRLLPVGWTPEAMARASLGHPLSAMLFLGLGATVPAVLLVVWRHVVQRLLNGEAAQNRSTKSKPLVPGWMDRLVDRRTAAAWAKSIRSIRRDPREWTELAAFLPLVLAFSMPAITQLDRQRPPLTLVPFLAAVSGATMVSTNLFGGDANRFVSDVFPGDDFRPILLGKLLPRISLVTVIVVTSTFGLAWVMDGWAYLVVALLLIVQSLMLGAAAGVWVSIRSPIPLPEKIGGFNAANAGCIAPLFQIFALFVADTIAVLFAAPAVLTALIVSPALATLAPLITIPLVLWIVKRWIWSEAARTRSRIPEITAALVRRT